MRRALIAVATVLSLCVALQTAEASNKKPSATIQLKGGSVAAGVGFTWEKGWLTYHGKKYPISADGFDVGDVGATKITGSGKVYNLKKLEDFNGNYTSASAGATLAGGGNALVMQNQNGVRIEMLSTTKGVKLTLGAGGITMKIK